MRPLASHGIENIAPIARRWLDRAAIIGPTAYRMRSGHNPRNSARYRRL